MLPATLWNNDVSDWTRRRLRRYGRLRVFGVAQSIDPGMNRSKRTRGITLLAPRARG